MLSVLHNTILYEYDRELNSWFQYDDKDIWKVGAIYLVVFLLVAYILEHIN